MASSLHPRQAPLTERLLPMEGDLDSNHTYAGVGRVLSEWEGIEAAISHLYAWFIGKLFEAEAYHTYGAGRIFSVSARRGRRVRRRRAGLGRGASSRGAAGRSVEPDDRRSG
jgi:hypothetical protein